MNIYNVLGLIGFFIISISAKIDLKRPGKVIIDTDGGVDDASAILLALATEKQSTNHGFEIIAITCTYGNTNLENVEQNILKILTIAGRTDIPVYSGVAKPLVKSWKPDFYFGIDGLGDVSFRQAIDGTIDRSKHASVALVHMTRQHAKNVSIFALGPLTNIALAIKLDANFVHNVERFYIMGASVKGVGNVAPAMEFNFYEDPHSNFIVLNSITESPAVLFPWESALGANISMSWRTDVLGAVDSPAIRLMNEIESKHFQAESWDSADMMLTALALWPNLIKSYILTNLTPIYDGAGQGSVMVDYKNITHKPPNVEILSDFDVAAFKKTLLDTFEIKSKI